MTEWGHSAARDIVAVLAAQPSRNRQRLVLDSLRATVADLSRPHPTAAPARRGVLAVKVAKTPYIMLYRQSQHRLTILRLIDLSRP